MGFISRFFTGSAPQEKLGAGPKVSVASLHQKIEKLTEANEKYRERLEKRIEQSNSMTETYNERMKARLEQNDSLRAIIDSQKSEMSSLRVHGRKEFTLERMNTFFRGTKLRLPDEPYAKFLENCKSKATPKGMEAFEKDMEETKYLSFFEQLFTVEMDMAQGFDFRTLRPVVTFQRGEADIALAKKQGITIDELKANQIRITAERFDDIIKKDFISPKKVKAVCEIGAAWGAATRYIINRYEPEIFHSYEIDTGWAQWLKDNLDVDSKQCDGESLSDTESGSMDMCMASSCLYFMPFVKQWNYLAEFARVLRPGGIAVFNLTLIENASLVTLKGLLHNHFPRRSFGYIPQHCVDTAFPADQFEKLVENPEKGFGYQVYRKL